jgi:hypothetical protein
VERIGVSLAFASGEEACKAALLGGPVALAYSRFDEATRTAVSEEYLRSIAGFERGGRYAIPGEFVVASGIRRES